MDRILSSLRSIMGSDTKSTKKQKSKKKQMTSEERESKLLESTLYKMSKAFKEKWMMC